MMLENWLIAW